MNRRSDAHACRMGIFEAIVERMADTGETTPRIPNDPIDAAAHLAARMGLHRYHGVESHDWLSEFEHFHLFYIGLMHQVIYPRRRYADLGKCFNHVNNELRKIVKEKVEPRYPEIARELRENVAHLG